MSPIEIYFLYVLAIGFEALWNTFLIERLYRNINHKRRWIYRVIFSIAFWIMSAVYSTNLELSQWWCMLLWMPFTFWAVFDTTLNWMRGLPIDYLGHGAWWDQFQAKHGGSEVWFIIKFLLAIFSTILYFSL